MSNANDDVIELLRKAFEAAATAKDVAGMVNAASAIASVRSLSMPFTGYSTGSWSGGCGSSEGGKPE